MKKLDNKLKIFILTIILFIISLVFIILNGNTYTVEIDNIQGISSIEDINIKIEDEKVFKCVDKNLENGIEKVKVVVINFYDCNFFMYKTITFP